MCFEITDEDFRFKYHHPLPDYIKFPANPKTQIDNSILKDLKNLAIENNCAGISYSKLSDEFRGKNGILILTILLFLNI